MRKAKRMHGDAQILGTLVLAAGETNELTVEIPGTLTSTGKPVPLTFQLHNTSGLTLAFDIAIIFDPAQKPEIVVEAIVRNPTSHENGELHEASRRRADAWAMVRDLRDGNANAC